jgi:hypothetical protein
MKTQLYAGIIISLLATGPAAAQNSSATSSNSGCDQWGLSGKDLADCRTQWAAAKTDAERDRVKAMYISPAFINSTAPNPATGTGSSTPPDNLRGPAGSAPQAPTNPLGARSVSPSSKPSSATSGGIPGAAGASP